LLQGARVVPVLPLRLAGLTDLQVPVFRLHPELLEIRLGPEGPEARLHLLVLRDLGGRLALVVPDRLAAPLVREVLRDLPDQEVLSLLVDQGPDRCIPTTSAP
jgi:hypothetical protein